MTQTGQPDETRVVLRRCVAYTIDALLVVVALVIVVWVTGDVQQVRHRAAGKPVRHARLPWQAEVPTDVGSAL